jgi:glycosyltransferase involved in cell wall biosynthesis
MPEVVAAPDSPGQGEVWLSVLFPAYNEAGSIRAVVEEADAALRDAGFSYEIVVLDDASTDDTWSILENLSGRFAALRLLRHEHNRGIQASLNDLFASARGDWLFHSSCDGQWKTAEVLRMIPLAVDRHTIVVGRRNQKHYGWWRSFVSAMYNILPFVLFGVRTRDAGSIKLFSRHLLDEVRPRTCGVFREGERLIRASRAGYRIAAIDVDCAPRMSGKATGARPALVAGAVRDLIYCWWRLVVCRDR